MKKLLLISVCALLLYSLCSCSLIGALFPEHSDVVNDAGNKLQDIFGEGLNTLQSLLNKTVLEAEGQTVDEKPGQITVYDDKIVLTVSPKRLIESMSKDGINATSLAKERKNAQIADMEYVLEYQCAIELKINGKTVYAACAATVHENALNQTISISIPINEADMSTTLYDLLQGGKISIESCLKHGTECTKAINERYTISTEESNDEYVLMFNDKRTDA